MVKVIYKSIKYLFYSAMVIILLLATVFLFKALVIKEQPVNMFGYSFYSVLTGSMEPEISAGDLVVVKRFDESHYQSGMIVTYLTEVSSTPVTHKIIDRTGDMITTQGTANNTKDAPFDVSCIIGEVVYVYSGYYKVSNFIKSPIGIIIIILGGLVIIEGFGLLDKYILKK